MGIDFNEIANNKINELHESGIIQQRIEDGIEKSIINAIDSSIASYDFRRIIEDNISKTVTEVASNVKFDSYVGLLTQRLTHLIESEMKDTISEKVNTFFNNTYLTTTKSVKLSEIIDRYKTYAQEYVDDVTNFDIEFTYHEYGWIDIRSYTRKKLNISKYTLDTSEMLFTIHRNRSDKNKGWISRCNIGSRDLTKSVDFKNMSDFDVFMFNIFFNQTEIIIDVNENNIDATLYDEDYY